MASLLQPDDPFADLPMAPDQPVQQSGSVGDVGTTAAGAGTPPTPGGTGTTGTAQGDSSAATALNSNVNFQPLLDTIKQGGTSTRSDLTNAQNTFNTGLGAAPVFGDTEKSTLAGAITGKTGLDPAKAMLNTQYGGPTGLNLDQFNTDEGNYQSDTRGAQTTGGISALLSRLNPALTQGENDFDTRAIYGNKDFTTGAQNAVNDSNLVSDLGFKANTDANNAITGRKSAIGDYNKAGTNYVQSQRDNVNNMISGQMTAANNSDTQLQAMLTALQNNGNAARNSMTADQAATAADVAPDPNRADPLAIASDSQLAFNRSGYGGRNVVNPASYLTYNPGALATRNNVATQDQANQYNNASSLLNSNDQITPQQRLAAMLGYNPALTMPAPPPPPVVAPVAAGTPVPFDPNNGRGGGGRPGEGDGQGGATAGDTSSGDQGSGEGAAASGSGEGGGSDGGDGGGDGGDGGGDGGGGGGGFAKGGLITKKKSNQIKPARGINTVPSIGGAFTPSDPATLTPQLSPMAPVAAPAALARGGVVSPMHAALVRRQGGGSIPFKGEPAGVDTVPTQTNSGEFVTRKPSVSAIGVPNMKGLNQINQASPQKQQIVRAALHAALGRR